MPFAKDGAQPVYLDQMKALLRRHPKTTIIWAHTGLGRVIHPTNVTAGTAERPPNHIEILEAILNDPTLRHVSFDISWNEVAKYAIATPDTLARSSSVIAIASCSAPTKSRPSSREPICHSVRRVRAAVETAHPAHQ